MTNTIIPSPSESQPWVPDGATPTGSTDLPDQSETTAWNPPRPPVQTPVTAGGIARQVLTGAEAAPYRILGAPSDIGEGIVNIGRRLAGYPVPQQPPAFGYNWWTRQAGKISPALNPENFPAGNLPERLARSSGEAAGTMVGTAGVGAVAEPALATPSAVKVGRFLTGSEDVAKAPIAATTSAAGAGAGAQAGGEYATSAMTPEFRRNHPALAAIIASGASMAGGQIGSWPVRLVPYVGGSLAQDITGSPERDAAIAAGKRLGVDVPNYMVGSPLTQRLGQLGHSIPFVSGPLEKAPEKMTEQMGTAAEREASAIGAGDPTGKTAGETVGGDIGSPLGVSPTVPPSGLRGWVKRISQDAVNKGYDNVTNALTNRNALTQPDELRQAAQTITGARTGQNLQDQTGGAVRFVSRALMDQRGMTYDNLKGLRTRLGQMMNNPSLLPADTDPAEVTQLYGALSKDLRSAASNAGGPQGVAAFDAANRQAAQVAANREQLVKFLGGSAGNASDEDVFKNLTRAGLDGGDLDRLKLARSKVDPNDWNELASSLVAKLGTQGEGGVFSVNKFTSAYNKFTSGGKDEIFGQVNDPDPARAATRQSMDDLQSLSEQAKALYSKYGNPSKTGHVYAAVELLKGLAHEPIKTVAQVVPARLLASALAKPATSGPIRNFIRTNLGYASAPSDATMRAMRYSAARVSSAMSANFGFNVNPDDLVNQGTQP
jgi:hypothetical protein